MKADEYAALSAEARGDGGHAGRRDGLDRHSQSIPARNEHPGGAL
jgi:hypothetical protein